MQNEATKNVTATETKTEASAETKAILGATETATKPEPVKKASKPRKPSKAKAKPKADKPDNSEAVTNRGLSRDASTIERQATNFDQTSDRDGAYLRFFGSVMRKHGNTATLAQIHEAGKAGTGNKRFNPHYTGSAKATDAGAINRLIKAGFLTKSDNGNKLRATKKALESSDYNRVK